MTPDVRAGGSARPDADAASVVVSCGGADHVVRVVDGGARLELVGHPGPRDADDVLVALSGQPARCRSIEDAWIRLDRRGAAELRAASPEQLARMAHRLPVTVEQRQRVAVRDDLTAAQRQSLLASFDQACAVAELASLGPTLARLRADAVLTPAWRRALRRRGRRPRP